MSTATASPASPAPTTRTSSVGSTTGTRSTTASRGRPLQDVFRRLEQRELLLADEAELRRRIPTDLPEILTLDEWRHPDVSGDELPSESNTFVQLAEVLVTGDVARYTAEEPPNTHWSNWPDGGVL